jgi:hypothetical protein
MQTNVTIFPILSWVLMIVLPTNQMESCPSRGEWIISYRKITLLPELVWTSEDIHIYDLHDWQNLAE